MLYVKEIILKWGERLRPTKENAFSVYGKVWISEYNVRALNVEKYADLAYLSELSRLVIISSVLWNYKHTYIIEIRETGTALLQRCTIIGIKLSFVISGCLITLCGHIFKH